MAYFKADYIYLISQPPLKNGIVQTTSEGEVIRLFNEEQSEAVEPSEVSYYRGVIVPGFVNSHCHLELSHLQGKIPEKTGLAAFIKEIQKIRECPVEIIEEETLRWQENMLSNGIVAMGDVCNGTHSITAKQKYLLHCHNFIELFSFNPAKAEESLQLGKTLLQQFKALENKDPHKFFTSSISPHAPYSTSAELIKKIANLPESSAFTVFIHNQESQAEDEMYLHGEGDFITMLHDFNISTKRWEKQEQSSLLSVASWLHQQTKMLWVHNTFSKEHEVLQTMNKVPNSYWCLCPSANLYIENTLPNFSIFKTIPDRVCLGTDSLASNHQLSILDEMKVINNTYTIDFETLLKWATINGAKALGFDSVIGSIEPGKTPGLNLLEGLTDELSFNNHVTVKKLI